MARVNVQAPAGEVRAVESLLKDLAADLSLPVEFTVSPGALSIGQRLLSLRSGASVPATLLAHRSLLVTTEVARALSIDLVDLRRLVWYGVSTTRLSSASDTLESALDAAGGYAALRVAQSTTASLASGGKGSWASASALLGAGMLYDLGIAVGPCELVTDDRVAPGTSRAQINDLRLLPRKMLGSEDHLVNSTVDRLKRLNVGARAAISPANNAESAIIDSADVKTCESSGLTTWDRRGHAFLDLAGAIRLHAGAMVTRSSIDDILWGLSSSLPALVTRIRERYPLERLAGLLRKMVDEGVGIRAHSVILETLLAMGPATGVDFGSYILFPFPLTSTRPASIPNDDSIVEGLRQALGRQITYSTTLGANTLNAYLLDPEVEELLQRSSPQPVPADDADRILAAITRRLDATSPGPGPVILTNSDLRHRLRRLIERPFPEVQVLAWQDLAPDLNIRPNDSRISF